MKKILRDMPGINIYSMHKPHERASLQDRLTFTVLREPAERFESFINYRLDEKTPREDWPKLANIAFQDKLMTTDAIVQLMTDDDILNFVPFRTMSYYVKGVDFLISIDQLRDFLTIFGKYNEAKYPSRANKSSRTRGNFSETVNDRIRRIFGNRVAKKIVEIGPSFL